MRRAVLLAVTAAVGLAASAGFAQDAAKNSGGPPRRASVALEVVHRYIRSLPVRPDTTVLAAQGTQEGHWRFVNRGGEMFTVGTSDEMQRVVSVLYPEARPGMRLALYMTGDTVFRYGAALKALPPGAEVHMVLDADGYRLLRRDEAVGGPRLFAEVRPNLAVELRSPELLEEALWHLSRPLGKARVRLLSLEPGGLTWLPAAPPIEAGSGRALVDAIDPASLAAAMAGVSGQTLMMLARVERDLLHVRPSGGPERSLALDDLVKAADTADVNLIVLQTAATPRQPAGRNPLWPDAGGQAAHAQLADLLNAVAGPARRLSVAATVAGRRTVLDVTLVGDLTGASAPRTADNRLADLARDMARDMATAGVYAVRANLLTAARQSELDRRIVRGVPLAVQAGYAALLVLGLIGTPVARVWWARVWPPEAASDYAGRTGYWAACTVRSAVFALVFLPLTAVVAAPYGLGRQIWDAVRGPAWLWRRTAGRRAVGAEAPQPPHPPPQRRPEPPPHLRAPAERQPPQRQPQPKPARSWIAALKEEEEPQ